MKKTTSMLTALVAAPLYLIASPSALAEANATHLFGDWGGARTSLTARGIDLDANYVNEISSNVSGGAERRTVYADQFFFGGTLDFDRVFGAPGSKIIFSFSNRNGESLAAKAGLNTLFLVDEVWGQGSYTRLNQFYLEQALFENAVDIKFGRMTGSGEFMAFSCEFQNQTFCGTLPAYMAPNWVPFPGSTWAGTVRLNLPAGIYVEGGVYEVNPAFTEHKYTMAFGKPFSGLGERYVLEGGWRRPDTAAPGVYRFGLWHDQTGGSDLYLNDADQPLVTHGGTPLQRRSQTGFYAMAQQQIWTADGDAERHIDVFANFVQGDSNVSVKDQIAEVGVFWKGPFALRSRDEIGLAVGRVHVSSRIRAAEQLLNALVTPASGISPVPLQNVEYSLELFYHVSMSPAFSLQPNVQVIHSPGGVAGAADVIVIGLKTIASF